MNMQMPFGEIDQIQVNEDHWGQGTTERIKTWLQEEFDPRVMPVLQLAQVKGRSGLWLLGWNWEGTAYPPLIEQIFGKGYAIHRMDQFEAEQAVMDRLSAEGQANYGLGKKERP